MAMSSLHILDGTKAGQRIWYCGLHANFIDTEQMSLKRMPHTANLQAERKERKKERKKGGEKKRQHHPDPVWIAVLRPQQDKSCLRRTEE